jgi:GT2 family glycosyltransferase
LLRGLGQHLGVSAEIIVVDNGSSDATSAIAQQYPCTVIRRANKLFPSKARNLGAAHSNGSVLVFLDADVEITQRWGVELLAQLASLQSGPAQITGDQYHVSRFPSWLEKNWFQPIRSGHVRYINGGNLITSRETYERLGGFDEQLETGEDVDFCVRAKRLGVAIVLNRNFVAHHEGYPKTIGRFLQRERWHGTSDFLSARRLLNSKVALATLVFFALNLAVLTTAVAALFASCNAYLTLVAGALVVLLCLLSVLQKFRTSDIQTVIKALPIVYVYYWGRSLSMFDALSGMLKVFTVRTRQIILPRRGPTLD